jgi:hypothetical protein
MLFSSEIAEKHYAKHVKAILDMAVIQANDSMMVRACKEIRSHYYDEIANVLISCDGTWQQWGVSPLYGAVFVIAFETGKDWTT